jgi:hypothetical protein
MPHGEHTKGEWISLAIFIGAVMFLFMMVSYKAGRIDGDKDEAEYLQTITEQAQTIERFVNLFKHCQTDNDLLTAKDRRRERLLLEIYLLNVKLEHKLDSISKRHGR